MKDLERGKKSSRDDEMKGKGKGKRPTNSAGSFSYTVTSRVGSEV